MKENEKFEKFAEALRERANEAIAEGENFVLFDFHIPESKIQRLPKTAEVVIDELKYYLENQEKIKKELQEPLDKYRWVFRVLWEWTEDDEEGLNDDDDWEMDVGLSLKQKEKMQVEAIDTKYNTFYLRAIYGGIRGGRSDMVVKNIRSVGYHNKYSLCYTYNGSVLSFDIWKIQDAGGPFAVEEIAVNTRLQFETEVGLKDLVDKVLFYI